MLDSIPWALLVLLVVIVLIGIETGERKIPGWVFFFVLGPGVLAGTFFWVAEIGLDPGGVPIIAISTALVAGPALMLYPIFRFLFREHEDGTFWAAVTSVIFSAFLNSEARKAARKHERRKGR